MPAELNRATEAKAIAGSDNQAFMTALRTKQQIDELSAGMAPLVVTEQSATSGGLWGVMDGAMIEFLGDVAYLFGGWAGAPTNDDWASGTVTNLVYKSEDFGVTWEKIRDHDLTPDSTHFIPCHFSPHCVHNVGGTDYIYLMGGDPSSEGATTAAYMHSQVRRTSDGITWTLIAADGSPGWDGVSLAAAGSLGGVLFYAGGHETPGGVPDLLVGTATSEVWKSTDNGATWTSMGNAPWPAGQCQDKLALHNGLLWRVGGGKYDNDNELRTYDTGVWSFDGTTWTEVLADGLAPWSGRFYANVFSHKGWLYISRGTDKAGNRSDTWRSRDGVHWYEVDLGAGFIASHADGLGVHADGFLQAAGNGRFTDESNDNSPTYFVTESAGTLTAGVTALIDSAFDSVTVYAGVFNEGYTEGSSPRRIVSGNNAKLLRVSVPHYTGTEEPITVIGGYSVSGSNYVQIGGGLSGAENSATVISIHVGTSATTLGTSSKEALQINATRMMAKYNAVFIGATESAVIGTLTADTPKLSAVVTPHYETDGTLTDVFCVGAYNSTTNANQVYIGGGFGSHYACTEIVFYAAATGKVANGTLQGRINTNGMALAGHLALGKTDVPSVYAIDAVGMYFVMGGDEGFSQARFTAATAQAMLLLVPNYSGTYTASLFAYSYDANNTDLNWGGGISGQKAATKHHFYAAADGSTNIGTDMMQIDVASTADNTGLLLLLDGTMKRVEAAPASGGYRVLRVAE
jgi:hypothetical protein